MADERRTEVAAHPVAGLAALLREPGACAEHGAPLPPLWHWAALSQWPDIALTGADGHPPPGDLLPPGPYRRRMWLGADVELLAPLPVGAPVTVRRAVSDVSEKEGRSGRFAVVTVRTEIRRDADLLLVEDLRLGYRPPGDGRSGGGEGAAPAPDGEAPAAGGAARGDWLRRTAPWQWRMAPDPVVLMWFSALTANPHRIHYDSAFTTSSEGHPGLLVHGPLMALVLAEVARRESPGRTVTHVSARARRPFVLGGTAVTRRTATGDDVTGLELVPEDGSADGGYVTAEVTFA